MFFKSSLHFIYIDRLGLFAMQRFGFGGKFAVGDGA